VVRFGLLYPYFERKQHQRIMNWNLGGRYSLAGLYERKTNRATFRNQGNTVGHLNGNLATLPNTNAGFVINEPLFNTHTHIHTQTRAHTNTHTHKTTECFIFLFR
jgi:hypothetical protein